MLITFGLKPVEWLMYIIVSSVMEYISFTVCVKSLESTTPLSVLLGHEV